MSLLIKHGKIYTMANDNIIIGDILVENGRIKEIAPQINVQIDDKNVIDAKNCIVMPGIIESHCHIGISEERKGSITDDCNEMTNPVTPYLRAIDAINPMDAAFSKAVETGITSVMVGPGSSNVVGGQFAFMKTAGSRCVDDLIVLEPAAMKVAFGENPKVQYGNNSKTPGTRMGIAGLLREELFKATSYWEKRKKGEKDIDFHLECWIPVLERKIPLKCHAHQTNDILTAIRIAREFHIDITLDHCTDGHLIAHKIKESGFPAIVGPSIASRSKIEVENMTLKTPGILSKEGILVSITTDHPVSIIQTLPFCAGLCVKNGMNYMDALKAITINAAIICRVDNRVGSLEVGKDADIAIFNGNPLELLTKCMYTIINGEIVYSERDKDESH